MTSHDINRRIFLKRAAWAGATLTTAGTARADGARGVGLVHDPGDAVAASAPGQWAVGRLRDALAARGVPVRLCRQMSDVAADQVCVVAGGSATQRSRDILARAKAAAPTDPES